MLRLSDLQAHFSDAVVQCGTSCVSSLLIGGRDPQKRLSIHQRNYRVSLTDALLTKFPATQWLLGTPFLTAVAEQFIRSCPPRTPCIAEYGSEFPDFIQECAPQLAYVRDFARLEWFVGKAAIAVDEQSGVYRLQVGWPVDELMTAYLTGDIPEEFELTPANAAIEIRGARGEFQLNRLPEEGFTHGKD